MSRSRWRRRWDPPRWALFLVLAAALVALGAVLPTLDRLAREQEAGPAGRRAVARRRDPLLQRRAGVQLGRAAGRGRLERERRARPLRPQLGAARAAYDQEQGRPEVRSRACDARLRAGGDCRRVPARQRDRLRHLLGRARSRPRARPRARPRSRRHALRGDELEGKPSRLGALPPTLLPGSGTAGCSSRQTCSPRRSCTAVRPCPARGSGRLLVVRAVAAAVADPVPPRALDPPTDSRSPSSGRRTRSRHPSCAPSSGRHTRSPSCRGPVASVRRARAIAGPSLRARSRSPSSPSSARARTASASGRPTRWAGSATRPPRRRWT